MKGVKTVREKVARYLGKFEPPYEVDPLSIAKVLKLPEHHVRVATLSLQPFRGVRLEESCGRGEPSGPFRVHAGYSAFTPGRYFLFEDGIIHVLPPRKGEGRGGRWFYYRRISGEYFVWKDRLDKVNKMTVKSSFVNAEPRLLMLLWSVE